MKSRPDFVAQTFHRQPVRLILFVACLACLNLVANAQAPKSDSPDIEARAKEMLSKLTLEQKIELIGGVDSMYTNAIPAINLPRLKMSAASVGVRTWGPTTAYAGGAALAAAWDRNFARELGESLGKDARSFSYWDETKHAWTIDPGKFTILVGDSSENTPLHADLTIS
jgi:beta-glucosidase